MNASVRPTAQADQGSLAGLSPGRKPSSPNRWRRRAVRILLALAVLGIGVTVMLDDAARLSSDHAVISTQAIAIRAPIAGEVTALDVVQGAEFGRGQILVRLRDTLADHRTLHALRAQAIRLEQEHATTRMMLETLTTLAAELEQRRQAYGDVALRLFAEREIEAAGLLAAAEARAGRAVQDRERRAGLRQAGHVAPAELERAIAEAVATGQEALALRARLDSVRAQLAGAARGVFVEPGTLGAGYAQQRLDDVALRRAEIERALGALAAEAVSLTPRLLAEEALAARHAAADLSAPVTGMVWRVHAAEGERVVAGATLLELVDCRNTFLVVAIPQDRVPGVAIGAVARYRLAGESRRHEGRVIGMLGESALGTDRSLAVLPGRPRGGAAVLKIALAPEAAGDAPCAVGRTARVMLPGGEGGVIARIRAALLD